MFDICHASGLAPAAGIGLKPQHCTDLIDTRPPLGFLEVHAENYMGAGGPPHRWLERLRRDYELSIHGVGLSIGGEGRLDPAHLIRLQALVARYEPQSFSEHLAWSTHEGVYLNDLLPLPYDMRTLARVCDHIDDLQTTLGRRMLLENPSSYLQFEQSTLAETEFLDAVARRTGCGLLLDVNNVHVSAANLGFDATAYLRDFPLALVGEIHLAGFSPDQAAAELLIDAHGTPVADPVWALYDAVLQLTGPVATLIEWDNDVPDLPILLAEASRAAMALAAHAPARA